MCFFFYSEGHYSVAKLILDSNAEVNVPSGSENNIPLTLACWKGIVNCGLYQYSYFDYQTPLDLTTSTRLSTSTTSNFQTNDVSKALALHVA